MTAALLTTVLFACTAVCATQAARRIGSTTANFARLIIALLLLAGWNLFWGRTLHESAGWLFGVAGAIGFGIGGSCLFQAFPRLGATLSLLVVECSAAVSTIIVAWLWLGSSISLSQSICAALSIGGVWLGLFPKSLPGVSRKQLLLGAMFAAIASIAQSTSFLLSKKAFLLSAQHELPALPMSAAAHRLAGGCLVAAFAWAIMRHIRKSKNGTRSNAWKPETTTVLWVIGNALAGPVLGVTCMLWAIREVGNPGIVQAVVATATLISVPLTRWTENQTLRWHYYLGASISIAGTAGLLLFP
jgi:drug/metabolite transporter (DMT)-like permease